MGQAAQKAKKQTWMEKDKSSLFFDIRNALNLDEYGYHEKDEVIHYRQIRSFYSPLLSPLTLLISTLQQFSKANRMISL